MKFISLKIFSWIHFLSGKKTTWQKKYEEIKEELAAAIEQRKKCEALFQKREDEHLEMITKMKRRIDDLEGMLNEVFVYLSENTGQDQKIEVGRLRTSFDSIRAIRKD